MARNDKNAGTGRMNKVQADNGGTIGHMTGGRKAE
jgi:hypothetical protein